MKSRVSSLLVLTSIAAACGPPSPPALEYRMPSLAEVVYAYADTSVVAVSVMGQTFEISQRGTARYGVDFASAPQGVEVTLSVEALSAALAQPMGAPIRIDQDDVQGELVFTLDRRGGALLTQRPDVRDEAVMMVSPLALAHTFFPRLPGRAAVAGESWVDTISFEGGDGAGERFERSVLRYTVVGDTVVDGRALLVIAMEGTTQSSHDMSISGMSVSQSSELEVDGLVLWDVQRGLMVESVRTATGSGTATVPVAPAPLPIRIESTQRARLQER